MLNLFVLVKKASAKNWQVAIPVKKGVSRAKLTDTLAKSRKKGYMYRVVTNATIKSLMKKKGSKTRKPKRKMKKKGSKTQKPKRKSMKRKKSTRRKKRK